MSQNNTYATVNESKHASKSLRHMTREALPRLDNYRNILSIHVGHRPTLDELHNNTVHEKVCKPLVWLSFCVIDSQKGHSMVHWLYLESFLSHD